MHICRCNVPIKTCGTSKSSQETTHVSRLRTHQITKTYQHCQILRKLGSLSLWLTPFLGSPSPLGHEVQQIRPWPGNRTAAEFSPAEAQIQSPNSASKLASSKHRMTSTVCVKSLGDQTVNDLPCRPCEVFPHGKNTAFGDDCPIKTLHLQWIFHVHIWLPESIAIWHP